MHETESKPCTEDLLPGLGDIQGRPEQPLLMGGVLTSAVPCRLKQQHVTHHLKQEYYTHHLKQQHYTHHLKQQHFTHQLKQLHFTHRL